MARKYLTNSEFRKRVNQKYGNQFTIISDYHGMKSKVKIRCNKCGWIGETQAYNFILRNYGSQCPTHSHRQYDSSSFQKAINQTQDNQYTLLSEYTGCKNKVKVKCNKCGKIFEVWPSNLLRGRIGKSCNHENCKRHVRLNFKQASKQLSQVSNGEIKLVHFSEMRSVATFECCKCGTFWKTKADNVFNGLTGCPACPSSKGEKAVTEYLKKRGYHFEPQFRIKTCRDILSLPFDFAVFNADRSLSCLIEYQGCQHFINPFFWKRKHGPFNLQSILNTQKHDAMKLQYCKDHNIKLIRINHPRTDSESRKHSFIASLVNRTLNKELKAS